MLQKLRIRNTVDGEGNPAGGQVNGVGIDIYWQDGSLKAIPNNFMARPVVLGVETETEGHNGAFVEGVIQAASKRLEFYQGSKFACEENGEAIKYLHLALDALESRTERRKKQGVEGTHKGN